MVDPAALRAGAGDTYRRLLGYTRRYWGWVVLGLIGVSLDAATQAIFVKIIQPLIDRVFVEKDAEFGLLLAGIVFLVSLVRIIGNFIGVYGMEFSGRHVVADLRRELFDRYLVLPTAFFDRHTAGHLISRVSYNSEQVASAATHALVSAVRDIMLVVYLVAVMLSNSVKLTATMLLLLPVIALVVTVISRRFRKISARIQDSMGDVAHVTEEAVLGHKVVKTFGGQGQERGNFELVNEATRRLNMRLLVTQLASSSLVQITAAMAMALLLFIGTKPSMLEGVSAGTFTSIFLAMVMTIPPLKRLTSVQAQIQRGIAAASSIFEVIDRDEESDKGTLDTKRVQGELEFRGLGFRYPDDDRETLRDVTFTIPDGSVTALVGHSGSGKTTLASLLPRFYGYQQGHILLDGRELADYRLDCLRRQIALVSQDIVLFNDTVRNNIAYGDLKGASDEDVRDAARAAHALAFIEALPDGFETQVGKNGVGLSGGQRQRIAIARALLKDAPILILDEATSALDSESEKAIQEALATVIAGRTTLVIAHRLSTIETADQVVVLDQGRVVERGSHAELLAQDGMYAALYRTQFKNASES